MENFKIKENYLITVNYMLSNELKDLNDLLINRINTKTSQFKLTIIEIVRRKYLNIYEGYNFEEFNRC